MDSATATWIIGGLAATVSALAAAYAKSQADRLGDAKDTVAVLREDVKRQTDLLNKLADGLGDMNRTFERIERALAARARRAP